MEHFLLFLIWIAAALFFPLILKRFQIPWVSAVIFAGMFLGPYGLGWVNPGEVTDFLAALGLIFLMFTAGLDTNFSVLKKATRDVFIFSLLNMGIPFATGFVVGFLWGVGLSASLLLGVVFSSSSIGVIAPMLREFNVESKMKSTLMSAVFLEDVVSLIFLAIFLNAIIPAPRIPLIAFPFFLILFLFVVLFLIPLLQEWLFYWESEETEFAGPMRAVMVTLALVALMAELIGVHAMVGGFLAGLTLSDMLSKRGKIKDSVFAISYGFLIPIFLLNLGMTTNISTLFAPGDILFTSLIAIALILSKSFSGFLGGRFVGFDSTTSLGMGIMTSAQMSTTLATASLGLQYGIFTGGTLAALVVLSIISILTIPILAKLVLGIEIERPSKFTILWSGKGGSARILSKEKSKVKASQLG
ncbi:MAG: cation:proton antiporter [Candidatus Bathyarchaeota archaeon]|nr:MAG: cation:proton antiporter [Candidatus Bathyarchaeota archaeon]